VKRISHHQSRRNRAKRERRVAARHNKAGHWKAQLQPMFTSGTIHYEIGANTDAMNLGGMGAVHRLVTKLGLVKAIDDSLDLLNVHLPYHESDHVLNLAYNVLCGGTRLEDIERLRHDTAYMNALGADLIPDPTTAGDFCPGAVTFWDPSPTSMSTAPRRRPMASRKRAWISPTRASGATRP